MADARATRRFTVLLALVFAGVALMLASIGVYGLLAHTVELRRHEIGVRRALGASSRQIMRSITGEGFGLAAAGSAFGALTSAFGGSLLQSKLYAVHRSTRRPTSLASP